MRPRWDRNQRITRGCAASVVLEINFRSEYLVPLLSLRDPRTDVFLLRSFLRTLHEPPWLLLRNDLCNYDWLWTNIWLVLYVRKGLSAKIYWKVKTPLGIRIVVCSVQREGHLLTLFAFRLIISASLTRGEIRYAVDGLYDRTVLYSTELYANKLVAWNNE